MIEDIKSYKLFFTATVLLLFLSFAFNFFGTLSIDEFMLNYKDSEALVTNQIKCGGSVYSNQMLEQKAGHNSGGLTAPCVKQDLMPYTSQFGLQGKIYTFIFSGLSDISNISVGAYVLMSQLVTAMITATVLGIFALWVRSRFGAITAAVTVFLLAISPMIVGFSRNLYWAVPLFILPIVFILYYYRSESSKKRTLIFWLILGLLLYLRFLCGYEYITTITIMVAAVVFYCLYMNKAKFKDYLRQTILIGLVAVSAFVAALATHVVSLNSYTGSTHKSLDIIAQRAEERTINSDKYIQYPYQNLKGLLPDYYKITDTYLRYEDHMESGSRKWAMLTAFSNYMLLPIVRLPVSLAPLFSVYIQSLLSFILLLTVLFVKRKSWVPKKLYREASALYLALSIGLLGYFSWLILGYSHALVHAHINGILMYLPFALFGYVVIGLFVEYLVGTKRSKSVRNK